MKYMKYTSEMVDFLSANVDNYSWAALAQHFNQQFKCNTSGDGLRCFCSKHKQISKHKTRKKLIYTEEMIDFLSSNLKKYNWAELTKHFNKNFNCNKRADTIMKYCCTHEKCSINRIVKRQPFTKDMVDFLLSNFENISLRELAIRFNNRFNLDIGVSVLKYYFSKNKITKILNLTDKMVNFLRANFKDIGHEELAHRFNNEFGLKKTTYNVRDYCIKYGLRKISPCTLPVGSEAVRNGNIFVKVDHAKWKAKHRLLWEQMNGPIPDGHCVIFADGNTDNFNIENLTLVTNREFLCLVKSRLIHTNRELTKIGINIAKIKIKIKDYDKKKRSCSAL